MSKSNGAKLSLLGSTPSVGVSFPTASLPRADEPDLPGAAQLSGAVTCEEMPAVIVVLDEASAHRELRDRSLACPDCTGRLRPWGYARRRRLRGRNGQGVWVRPPRARCADCSVTHVLLRAEAPLRRADTIEVIGPALLAHAQGQGHRAIADDLGVPPDTVRGWIRTVSSRASWLQATATAWTYRYDPHHVPSVPTASPLADALSALGAAAAATRRLLPSAGTPWALIALIARGRLLAPLLSG